MKYRYLLSAGIIIVLLLGAGVHADQALYSENPDKPAGATDINETDMILEEAAASDPDDSAEQPEGLIRLDVAEEEDLLVPAVAADESPHVRDEFPAPPAGAVGDSRGNWVIKDIRFDVGHSEVRPEFHSALNEVVKVLKMNPELRVEIQGYTDNTGTEAFNQHISRERAREARVYLAGQGIDDRRMTSKGYGSDDPLASNETPEGRARNRRIEIKPFF